MLWCKILFFRAGPISVCEFSESVLEIFLRGDEWWWWWWCSNAGLSKPLSELILTLRLACCETGCEVGWETMGSFWSVEDIMNLKVKKLEKGI